MVDQFYDYEARKGIRPIAWQDYFGLCKGLALAVAPFQPEIILGIMRGGLYPAALLSHFLRIDMFPIRLTRRQNDRVVHDMPRWVLQPPATEVHGRRVLIVDEICSEGITLRMAEQEAQTLGAVEVRSAVLYAHTWGQGVPDYIGLITDELIMNPWDREVVTDGRFVFHPEYAHALEQQGLRPDPALLIGVEPYPLAKG